MNLTVNLNGWRPVKYFEDYGVFKVKGGEIKESSYTREDGETQYQLSLIDGRGYTENITFTLDYGKEYTLNDGSTRTDNSLSKIIKIYEVVTGKPVEKDTFNLDSNTFKNKEIVLKREEGDFDGMKYKKLSFYDLSEYDEQVKLFDKKQKENQLTVSANNDGFAGITDLEKLADNNELENELLNDPELSTEEPKKEEPVVKEVKETKTEEVKVEVKEEPKKVEELRTTTDDDSILDNINLDDINLDSL